MYFSKIQIKEGPTLFHFLKESKYKDLYAAHQLLWRSFPEDKNAKRDFLFYQDESENMPCFYVVSSRKPSNHDLFYINAKEYSPRFNLGQKLCFKILANPIVSKSGKKHDVWMNAKHEARSMQITGEDVYSHCEKRTKEWLTKRSESLGFNLQSDDFVISRNVNKQFRKKGRNVSFAMVEFEGVLEVSNVTPFLNMLYEGIGSSRAFGCGLMMVKNL